MFDQTLSLLLNKKNLSAKHSEALFTAVFKMELSEKAIQTVLVLLAQKGESKEEVLGCVKALEKLEPKIPTKLNGLMDTCGTGGDNSQSVNVSTLSAFVIAASGGRVAKHGNRSISSKCGSSDLMEALGVRLDARPTLMLRSLKDYGLGYFHAPLYHPVFRKVQPIRQKLGIRTIFNFLGPMVNPLKLDFQLVGISKPEIANFYADVLRQKALKRAWICHADDGLDELSCNSISSIIEIRNRKLRRFQIDPADFKIAKIKKSEYQTNHIHENKRFAIRFLKGEKSHPADSLIYLNAAAGLTVSGIAGSVRQGYKMATEVTKKGEAFKILEGIVRISNE